MTLMLSGHFFYIWFGFFLFLSPFWEFRENGVVKNLQFKPQSLGAMLDFSYVCYWRCLCKRQLVILMILIFFMEVTMNAV